jgi:hypothetical protein
MAGVSKEKIARIFVHYSKFAASFHSFNGGDEFVHEYKNLRGVRKVCRPDFGDQMGTKEMIVDLKSLAPKVHRWCG